VATTGKCTDVLSTRRSVCLVCAEKYDVVDQLEVVEESGPVENVECDEREREQKSRDGVDLADTVHLAGDTGQRLHAIVAASPGGRPDMQALGHRGPDAAAALSASPQLRRTARRRRRDGIGLSAALGGSGQHRRLRLSVDILRRRQSALNRFVSGATVARLCRALFDFLHAFSHVELSRIPTHWPQSVQHVGVANCS